MKTETCPELWGGVECTINRVGDIYYDQARRSGHTDRAATDLELFANLGLRTLRTGLLWERYEEAGSWSHADSLLAAMKRLNLRPVAGLLHHGSGPPSTNLLDPEFPQKLAVYAERVANRYPDIVDYTPVNEPQTTGRFGCLYAYWHPHEQSMRSYLRALFNQIKGIVLSMRAIRAVQPSARLIHTEDGGETFSTHQLDAYRIEREHRRWLGMDLLCGKVDRTHPLFCFLLQHGITEKEVYWFEENACPPSILGLNYYVTSDRYLDHRVGLYPFASGGDTGAEPLADVEAVRVRSEGIAGAGAMLRQAWTRYGLPVALTEAHLGCDALEQGRWLAELWRESCAARSDGVDVRAVCAWSLLGSYDWSNLCRFDKGYYEPGVFDVSSGRPVATPLAELVFRLSHGLPQPAETRKAGWWRLPERITVRGEETMVETVISEEQSQVDRVL